MSLDYANERWVKSPTRDTADWLELSLEAQGLLKLLERKVDRAGVLELGKKGKRAVALVLNHPHRWQDISVSLAELERAGQVLFTPEKMLLPDFLAREEALVSDRQRQRNLRERRASMTRLEADAELLRLSRQGSPAIEATPEPVTPRDTESRDVTECHERSRTVTTGHSGILLPLPKEDLQEEGHSVTYGHAASDGTVALVQENIPVGRRAPAQSGLPLGPVGVVPVTPPEDTPPLPAVVPEPSQETGEAFTPEDAARAKVAWDACEDVRLELYGAKPGRLERPPDGRHLECLRCFEAHEGRPEWIRQTARRWNLEDPTNFAKRRNPRGSSSVFFAPPKHEGDMAQWESFQRAQELEEPAKPAPAIDSNGDPASRESWGRVLEVLTDEGKSYALSWLQRMEPLELADAELRMAVPDRFFGDWVEGHYRELLDEALERTSPGVRLVFVLPGEPVQVRATA